MSTQHALTKFVGPIKVAGVEGSRCLGHHRAPVRIHGSGGRSRRHGCLEQPPFTGCLHHAQGSVSGGGGMNGPTELVKQAWMCVFIVGQDPISKTYTERTVSRSRT